MLDQDEARHHRGELLRGRLNLWLILLARHGLVRNTMDTHRRSEVGEAMSDKFDKEAEELSPCNCGTPTWRHHEQCSIKHQVAVAARLRADGEKYRALGVHLSHHTVRRIARA